MPELVLVLEAMGKGGDGVGVRWWQSFPSAHAKP
jgi:hypothetical protein